MKWRRTLLVVVLAATACNTATPLPPTLAPTPTATLAQPEVRVTRAPDPVQAAQVFLDAWQAGNTAQMYAITTRDSRSLTEENFAKLYQDTASALTLTELEYTARTGTQNIGTAMVPYQVTFHTSLFGDLQRDLQMDLVMEDGGWKVKWVPTMLLPELAGGHQLQLTINVQPRGQIYSRDGGILAEQAEAIALGVDPGAISTEPGKEETLLTQLAGLLGKWPEWVEELYASAAPGYVPIGESLADDVREHYDTLSNLYPLLYMNPYEGRYYPNNGIAPHVTGYTLGISAENLAEYQRKGYLPSEKYGAAGIEAWGEDYLRGKPEAVLTIVDSQGQPVGTLAQSSAQQPQNITTTIDPTLQQVAQNTLKGFNGAIVVIERDTGRVLAMASSPAYNPNLFEAGNYNLNFLGTAMTGDNPMWNRAARSGYPLGSVFKIVTMAAALESGMYGAEEPKLECGHTWTEIPGVSLEDWTLSKELPPSSDMFPGGMLTLPQGLMRSCNPWFYHIGWDLYNRQSPTALSDIARGFGLGSLTGIEVVEEDPGNVPNPTDERDAAVLGIGQSTLLVTPLQVARFVAAVGNGGTLYRPQLIELIGAEGGVPSFTFEPDAQGSLPVSAENLQIIQAAMLSVVEDPKGTANSVLRSYTAFDLHGKTGTAQSDQQTPHAWFAGYTDNGNPDKPDIAIAVLVEYAGEGSEIAAPIFRRMIETYYYGSPRTLMRWEARQYVTRTPTPIATNTPVPQPTDIIIPTSTPEMPAVFDTETPTPE